MADVVDELAASSWSDRAQSVNGETTRLFRGEPDFDPHYIARRSRVTAPFPSASIFDTDHDPA
jgi:hypothetical protein